MKKWKLVRTKTGIRRNRRSTPLPFFLNDNKNEYLRFLRTQKLIRDVDEIHIIDNEKKLLHSSEIENVYIPPVDRALNLVLEDDRPLKIINAPENISAAIIRLQQFDNRFLYVIKYLDKDISKYLTESREAINFYYTVEEKSTGIKISFAIIYIIVVSVLLFVSISIAIRFSSRFFRSINNLISASNSIGEGNLITHNMAGPITNPAFHLRNNHIRINRHASINSTDHLVNADQPVS